MKYFAWTIYFISTITATIFAASIPLLWGPFIVAVFFCLLSAVYVFILRFRVKYVPSRDPGNYMAIFKDILAETIILDKRIKFFKTEELKLRIEKLQSSIEDFVAYRDKLQLEFGMERYGEIYSSFSLGELYVNRAWSAVVDSNLDEAHNSIVKARRAFAVIGN